MLRRVGRMVFIAVVIAGGLSALPVPALAQSGGDYYTRVPGGREPRYQLGLQDPQYTSSGVKVTCVIRNTPAWRLGLEPGDYITAVDGNRVGIVNGLVYPLANDLQRSNGTVELEIWNRRTRRYETHTVELMRR